MRERGLWGVDTPSEYTISLFSAWPMGSLEPLFPLRETPLHKCCLLLFAVHWTLLSKSVFSHRQPTDCDVTVLSKNKHILRLTYNMASNLQAACRRPFLAALGPDRKPPPKPGPLSACSSEPAQKCLLIFALLWTP